MKTDVLVIGGSATGLVAAMTAKSHYPDKSVTVSDAMKRLLFPAAFRISSEPSKPQRQHVLPDED
jgi:predicted flavoprotein YhiN